MHEMTIIYIFFSAIAESLHIYSLESGSRMAVISRHFQPVTRVIFFPCGNYFVSAGEDGFLYLWSMASVYNSVSEGNKRQNIQPFKLLGQHSDKVTIYYLNIFNNKTNID